MRRSNVASNVSCATAALLSPRASVSASRSRPSLNATRSWWLYSMRNVNAKSIFSTNLIKCAANWPGP
jgi:hypothetical protein